MPSIFRRKGRRGWTLKWNPATGPAKMRAFRRREDAENFALHLRTHPDSGDRRTLAAFAADWLAASRPLLRPGSLQVYAWALRKHLLPTLGELELRALTRAHVRDMARRLHADGLARKTVANVVGVLEACLTAAVGDGTLHVNVAAGGWRRALARADAGARALEPVEAFAADQLRRFLDAAGRVVPRFSLRFRIMALTGLRIGEVLGLQWTDVDLNGRTIRVARGVTPSGVQPPKSGRPRTVDVAAGLRDDLAAWDAATKASALQRGADRAAWVFPARHGGPARHRETEQAFKRALVAARLPPHHTPHSLRHTYASLQLVRGISPLYVQRQLGHASLKMTTETYGRWLPMGDAAAADGLEAAVTPAVTERPEETAGS